MPRKPGLDRAGVVEAAIELANGEGASALTLGRLADQLGIRTPSLYNHIDGLPGLKRELTLANAQRLAACLRHAVQSCTGPDALAAAAQAYRDYILQQPGLYLVTVRASGTQPAPDPELAVAEDQVVQVVLGVLDPFGLTGDDALHAVRGLRSIVHGFATLELAGGFGLPLDCDESFRRLIAMFVRELHARSAEPAPGPVLRVAPPANSLAQPTGKKDKAHKEKGATKDRDTKDRDTKDRDTKDRDAKDRKPDKHKKERKK